MVAPALERRSTCSPQSSRAAARRRPRYPWRTRSPACLELSGCLPPQDARDFGVDGYTLRLQRMDRKIKLFICVTLYNEDYDELRKTLVGICDVSAAGGRAWRPGTGGRRGLPMEGVGFTACRNVDMPACATATALLPTASNPLPWLVLCRAGHPAAPPLCVLLGLSHPPPLCPDGFPGTADVCRTWR